MKLVLGNELAVGILDPGALRDEFLAGLIAAFTRRTRTSCERLGKIEVLEPVGELGGADLLPRTRDVARACAGRRRASLRRRRGGNRNRSLTTAFLFRAPRSRFRTRASCAASTLPRRSSGSTSSTRCCGSSTVRARRPSASTGETFCRPQRGQRSRGPEGDPPAAGAAPTAPRHRAAGAPGRRPGAAVHLRAGRARAPVRSRPGQGGG